MERYYKNMDGDYITGIGIGLGDVEITREEYETIRSVVRDHPEPDEGYTFRLRADLTWALVEATVEEDDAEATEADYLAALAELGVSL